MAGTVTLSSFCSRPPLLRLKLWVSYSDERVHGRLRREMGMSVSLWPCANHKAKCWPLALLYERAKVGEGSPPDGVNSIASLPKKISKAPLRGRMTGRATCREPELRYRLVRPPPVGLAGIPGSRIRSSKRLELLELRISVVYHRARRTKLFT